MTDDDEIDQLYASPPEAFTALRAELVAAAKNRGDKDAVKRIGAARRPTTAAWVVNVLVRTDGMALDRLTALGADLRAAHASMDGSQIRELSSAQRKLIDELSRRGFAAAGLPQPSAAMRDDVVGTLQAAIADPEVAARLGRLSTAERWSGFGEFGTVSAVGTRGGRKQGAQGKPEKPGTAAKPTPSDSQDEAGPTEDEVAAARDRVNAARSDVDSAKRGHADAIDALSERTSKLATARRRYEKLLETLSVAEQELGTADKEHGAAEQSARSASDLLEKAKSALAEAESDVADLGVQS